MTPVLRRTKCLALLFMVGLFLGAGEAPADGPSQTQTLTRERLIGAWRLVAMDYRGPNGATIDPFYQPNSTGILIYDASGWMSVHISAPDRPVSGIPVSRISSSSDPAELPLKAAAFDTYYAYFGTWEFNPPGSVVTHHIVSALIPGETGRSYSQSATLEGGRLTFTTRAGSQGAQTVRTKVWVREASR